MLPVDFNALAQECAPQTAPATLAAIVRTESGFNPYAIGVVGGRLDCPMTYLGRRRPVETVADRPRANVPLCNPQSAFCEC